MGAIIEQFILSRFLIDAGRLLADSGGFWQSIGYRSAATFDLCSILID